MSQLPPALHGLANAIELAAYHTAEVNGLDQTRVPLAMAQAFINQWSVFIIPPPKDMTEEEEEAYRIVIGSVRNVMGAMLFPVLQQLERLVSQGVPIDAIFEEKRDAYRAAFDQSYAVVKEFGLAESFNNNEVGQA